LKHRHGGDETRWIAALVPLVPSSSIAPGSKAALAISGLFLKKAFLVAALVTLLVPIGWRLLAADEARVDLLPALEHVAAGEDSVALDAAKLSEPAARPSSRATSLRRSTKQAAIDAALDGLEGAPQQLLRVLDAESNRPIRGATVHVMSSQRMLRLTVPGS